MTEIERLRKENEKLKKLLKKVGTASAKLLEKLSKEETPELFKEKPECVEKAVKLIWGATPPKGRSRSSQLKLEKAWRAVPVKDRPSLDELLMSLVAWGKSEDWTKENGQFVLAIDRWVRERRWNNTPAPAVKKATHKILPV